MVQGNRVQPGIDVILQNLQLIRTYLAESLNNFNEQDQYFLTVWCRYKLGVGHMGLGGGEGGWKLQMNVQVQHII